MGSIYEVNEKSRKENNTYKNTFADFPIGSRVKVICACQDFNFFWGETGVVIANSGQYLGINVKFDDARHFEDGSVQESFNFAPDDLVRTDKKIKHRPMGRSEAVDWLDDLKKSVQNEITGTEGGERERKRIEALEVAVRMVRGRGKLKDWITGKRRA
jgi:hypothetical protein